MSDEKQTNTISRDEVKTLIKQCLEPIATDITRLANAVEIVNRYGSRVGTVTELCKMVLAPSPEAGKAQANLSELKSARSAMGRLEQVTAEWDSRMNFLIVFRGSVSWSGPYDGFSLIAGTPGFDALKIALGDMGVELAKVDKFLLQPIETPKHGTLRRVLFE